ncbi:S41 family peptidase [Chitinophaga horti]|uniref:S41 family peptidase n=1 Tax=Chitinophaga horti TaxID=2920382 RepID=A0ABY6J5F6_9BACT|nr:S41 family peptidase [Chitinophaga horti]UYQ93817.1 S41 family peptidase [Chitinophaga horti]
MKTITRIFALFLLAFATYQAAAHPARKEPAANTAQTSDLVLLARVWGYLKYFSPAISERDIDWDKVLITQLQYLDENSAAGIGQPLKEMLDAAIPVMPSGKKTGARQLAKAKAIEKVNVDYSWIRNASQLSTSDKERLLALADHFAPFRNKYVDAPEVAQRPSPVFKEDSYGKQYLPEKYYRLLALFRYWNIMEYYLPAKYQQNGTWPQTLAKLIPEFTAADTDRAYGLALMKLNAAITDGHTIMPTRPKFNELIFGSRLVRLPFSMGVIGDTVLVTHMDSGFAEISGMRRGDRILDLNGKPVRQYADSLKAFMSEPRDVIKEFHLTRSGMLQRIPAPANLMLVTFERAGKQHQFAMEYKEKEQAMYARSARNYMLRQVEQEKQQPVKPAMRMLEGDVLFIDPSKWTGTMADTTRKLLAKAKSLIIECRTYPNFDFINFTSFLFKRSTKCLVWNRVSVYPGLTKTMDYVRGPDHTIHFKGPVVALISEASLSRPEMLTMIIKARGGNTRLIGRATAGADGDVTPIPMVGDQQMYFFISGLGVLYPDGGYTQGIGIPPDIEVPNSLDQLDGTRDVIFERAVEYLASQQY